MQVSAEQHAVGGGRTAAGGSSWRQCAAAAATSRGPMIEDEELALAMWLGAVQTCCSASGGWGAPWAPAGLCRTRPCGWGLPWRPFNGCLGTASL